MYSGQIISNCVKTNSVKKTLRISGSMHKPDIARQNFYNGKLYHTIILESSEQKIT